MSRPVSEDSLIDWLRRQPDTLLIGNDAAVLPSGGPFAVTVDHQIEGVHFPPGLAPDLLARRLLAVNLSDLAAMGASPAYAFLALAAPAGFDHKRFFAALLAACRRYGLELAGGDLAKNPHGVTAALTLLGTKEASSRWLNRDGARPGHGLWLGGTVGESAAGRMLVERGARLTGRSVDLSSVFEVFSSLQSLRSPAARAVLRHLQPHPQLELGRWLGIQKEGAAMDISDGVARDLHRLCRASSTGAEIEAEALPFSKRFTLLCETIGADPLALALGGGEDYVLLFTLPAELAPPLEFACRRIGTITRRSGVVLLSGGNRRELPALGWDHLS
ncbi:MAG TPA: thiamine-phosphate kinase [Thermoanaerobaculia bacterium]|nr:thiamine-phosphate kinase [Thermoanaerobaculia bacterium]